MSKQGETVLRPCSDLVFMCVLGTPITVDSNLYMVFSSVSNASLLTTYNHIMSVAVLPNC